MNDKIKQIKNEITQLLYEEYPEKYIEYVFNGKIEVDDFVKQVILECIKYAFDHTQEKHSIRYFLKTSGKLSDDERMKYSRLMSLVQEYKRKEIENLKLYGLNVDDTVEDMNSIADKLQGYNITEMNFFEITNIDKLELIKAIINRRLMFAKKISNQKFKEIAIQYDKFVLSLKENSLDNDEKMVFNSLAFFTIEWKYGFNFLYRCINEMDYINEEGVEALYFKIGMLIGYRYYISLLGNTIATDSRMVGYRESLIKEFLLNSKIENQYCEMLSLVTTFKQNAKISGLPIKEWFIENTNIGDWASFFREYDVFKAADFNKDWTNKHIQNMRKICEIVFPENAENRFDSEEAYFDTMMSEIKENMLVEKFDCYIEEYTNSENKLCARLREKRSNKRIVLCSGSDERNNMLRFLSLVKKNIELMPTVFDRDGDDIVAVQGIKQAENDESIQISFDAIGAGCFFE